MLDHRTPLWRWLSWHRYQLAAAAGLFFATAALIAVAPLLLAVSALEWKRGHRRVLGLALLSLLTTAIVWLWRGLHGLPREPWHSCVQCGAPIEEPSRAEYCSPACRHVARLERERSSPDPWIAACAETRLRILARATTDPAPDGIPF
jgi:hypothetical protein